MVLEQRGLSNIGQSFLLFECMAARGDFPIQDGHQELYWAQRFNLCGRKELQRFCLDRVALPGSNGQEKVTDLGLSGHVQQKVWVVEVADGTFGTKR